MRTRAQARLHHTHKLTNIVNPYFSLLLIFASLFVLVLPVSFTSTLASEDCGRANSCVIGTIVEGERLKEYGMHVGRGVGIVGDGGKDRGSG